VDGLPTALQLGGFTEEANSKFEDKGLAKAVFLDVAPLNKRRGGSTMNRVLLYKQIICPVMDYVCPKCRSPANIPMKHRPIYQ
jgi:hypothetical protein